MPFNIQWVPVVSSAVSEVAYGEETTSIYVKFVRGAVYRYEDCTREEFDELVKSGSVGQHVNEHLRHKVYYEVVLP